MRLTTAWMGLAALVLAAVCIVSGGTALAAPPEAPKPSTYAPAENLAAQLEAYLDDLKEAVSSEDEYKQRDTQVVKEANTLILIATALGLHDTDNPYKAAAPALIKAAKDLAATKDYASAKAGVAALLAATKDSAGGEVKWEKSASLEQLMKQVPTVNTKMKTKLKRFSKSTKDIAGHSAVLAVIAQGAMYDTSPAKDDEQIKKWYEFCTTMRNSAGGLNQAAHAGDQAAADAANKTLAQSCDDCHAVFKPDAGK